MLSRKEAGSVLLQQIYYLGGEDYTHNDIFIGYGYHPLVILHRELYKRKAGVYLPFICEGTVFSIVSVI